jgi:nitrite reductase/ring-hydroxylating ferredoxin subunit
MLVGAGILAAVPTAATGVNDWADTYGDETRIGVVHAGANVAALALYVTSFVARRRGQRARGKALGLAGFAVLLAGGYLGGHLSFVRGVNVNHTAFEHRPEDWTAVLPEGDLAEGEHRKVLAGEAPVLLVRSAGALHALSNTCTHAGGPLDEGEFADGCVTCPWHGSTFRLEDGAVVRGPASTPEPSYETRVREGWIEVRARA